MKHSAAQIHIGPMFDREPPHSRNAEVCLLAAAYLSPAGMADATRIVSAADFFFDDTRRVFIAISELYRSNQEIDLTLVQDRVAAMPDFDPLAFARLVDEMSCQMASAVGVEAYAKLVRQKSKLRELIAVCGTAIHLAYTAPDDSGATIGTTFEQVAALARSGSSTKVVHLQDACRMVVDALDSGKPAYLRTGMYDYDLIAGGVMRSGIWTIFGAPGSGKSTFAMEVAKRLSRGLPETEAHAAQDPIVVRYYSVEQAPIRAAATILSQDSGLGVHGFLNTSVATEEEKNAVADASIRNQGNFAFFDSSLDPNQLFAECAALSTKHPHGALFVDYLQDLPPFGQFIDLTPRITESMRILARIARELGWLVVVISQTDKASGKMHQVPKLTDGLGSSAIEQRSDLISYVYRPHQREVSPPTNQDQFGIDRAKDLWRFRQVRTMLGILKNKYGCTGMNQMQFVPRAMTFKTPDPEVLAEWKELRE